MARTELEDLALRVRESLAPPPARAAFKAAARWRLIHRLPHLPSHAPARRSPAIVLLRRLAFAAASVLLAFSLGTAGVAYAAQEAMPGDTLYGVKRGIETVRWSLTEDPRSQAALLSDLAAERMREIQALADAGRDALLAPTLNDYMQTLDRLQAVADALPESIQVQVLAQASARVQQHEQALERLLGQVSPQACRRSSGRSNARRTATKCCRRCSRVRAPAISLPGRTRRRNTGPSAPQARRTARTSPDAHQFPQTQAAPDVAYPTIRPGLEPHPCRDHPLPHKELPLQAPVRPPVGSMMWPKVRNRKPKAAEGGTTH